MSNNVSRVSHYDDSSSYSPSGVSPQGKPHGASHVREHGNKVQESNIRTNRSGHDSISSNLADGCIPHGDRHPTGMQNVDDGTMNHCNVQPSDTNDWRHGMSNDVSQLLNDNISSSYSLSRFSPQGNPSGSSHVRKHDNKVHKHNLLKIFFS